MPYFLLLPTSYFLLPTSYFLLLTSYFLLGRCPTSYYFLLPTGQVPYFLLPTSYYFLLLPTSYWAGALLPTTSYFLLPTGQVPYFLLGPKGMALDGSNPTLLDGYGGFEISLTPGYSGSVGAAWLARGGVKAIANIRGGGEYGPRWHQAALRERRHLPYKEGEETPCLRGL